jgi:hypothetical protein
MKRLWLVGSVLASVTACASFAQVSITGQESVDKAVTGEQVIISTMDRSYMPVTIETKETKVDPTTTRTESVMRARLNDGSYFDFRNTTATTQQPNSNTTQSVINIVENDRQGGERTTRRVTEETTKTASGERSETSSYRRNSSGKLVLDSEVVSTTTKSPDGTLSTVSVEKRADVGGTLQPEKRIEQTITERGPNEKQVVSKIMTVNHMDGGFGVSSRETATIRTDGNTTSTETTIQKPSGASWQDTGKVVTKEIRDPDGSVRRETIEEGLSLYAQKVQRDVGPLVPQRKIVESEVRKPDGTIMIDRGVYRRDVNGNWTPVTFSVEAAAKATSY